MMLLQFHFIAEWYERIQGQSHVHALHTRNSEQNFPQEPDESVRMDLLGNGARHSNNVF